MFSQSGKIHKCVFQSSKYNKHDNEQKKRRLDHDIERKQQAIGGMRKKLEKIQETMHIKMWLENQTKIVLKKIVLYCHKISRRKPQSKPTLKVGQWILLSTEMKVKVQSM